jgi:hypothetical protein
MIGFAPKLMKFLAIAGTAAMCLVYIAIENVKITCERLLFTIKSKGICQNSSIPNSHSGFVLV